ncbi:hypothetical protein D9M73_262390 [compost metagenome]
MYLALGPRNAPPTEFQVAAYREVGEQAGFLEHITDGALVRGDEQPAAAVLPHLAIDFHIGLAGFFQAGEAAQAGGLARSGGAEQGADAAPWQLQVDVQGKGAIVQLQAGLDGQGSTPAGLALAA